VHVDEFVSLSGGFRHECGGGFLKIFGVQSFDRFD